MGGQNKHVVFDIVGTCISYENFFEALEARLGPKLNPLGIGTRIFGYAWMEAAEREYTYLSLSNGYRKVFDVMRSIFYRTLWQAGIAEPRKLVSDEDMEFVLDSYRGLKPREGLAECYSKLREAGFTVWAFTAGDTERVSNYLKKGGVEMPSENFVSCDDIGIGKPAPESYEHILGKFDKKGLEAWFAAAHMWDASAARRSGFKGAWCSAWEKEPCSDIFGEMDVVAPSLPAMADGIIAASTKQ